MKAIEIKCPVEACSRGVGEMCKMVDLQKHPFFGAFHLDRIQAAGKQERDNNKEKRENAAKEQDAKKLLRSTNRVVCF